MIQILKLAAPVVFGQIMQNILNFADRYFIAKLGIHEAAGASLCFTLIWFLITTAGFVSGGTIAIVSRKVGEKNEGETNHSAEQSIILALCFGLIIASLLFLSSERIFSFFRAEKLVEKYGLDYFKIMLFCVPLIILVQTMAAIFIATGDTKTPMIVLGIINIFNLIFDPIFIFESFDIFGFSIKGMGLGIKGAGYATLLCIAISVIWVGVKLRSLKLVKIRAVRKIRPDFSMMKRILRVGFWVGLNGFSRPLSAVAMQRILSFHGTKAIAAFIFGLQWISLLFIFLEGMRIAITTLIGRNLGKKDMEQVDITIRSGILLGNFLMVFFMLFGFIFAKQGIGLFINDPEVIKLGTNYLNFVLIGLIFGVPMTVYGAVFNGSGNTIPPMIIGFVSNWIGKIAVAYALTFIFGFGVNATWLSITVSLVLEGTLLYIWYKRGTWRTIMV